MEELGTGWGIRGQMLPGWHSRTWKSTMPKVATVEAPRSRHMFFPWAASYSSWLSRSHVNCEAHKGSTLGPSQNTGEPSFPLVKCSVGTLWRVPPLPHPKENCQPLRSVVLAACWAHISCPRESSWPTDLTHLLHWQANSLLLSDQESPLLKHMTNLKSLSFIILSNYCNVDNLKLS